MTRFKIKILNCVLQTLLSSKNPPFVFLSKTITCLRTLFPNSQKKDVFMESSKWPQTFERQCISINMYLFKTIKTTMLKVFLYIYAGAIIIDTKIMTSMMMIYINNQYLNKSCSDSVLSIFSFIPLCKLQCQNWGFI